MKKTVLFILIISLITACSSKESKPEELTILIRMMDIQDEWFRERLSQQALDELNVKLNFVTFNDFNEVEVILRNQEELGVGSIGVVKTPITLLSSLVNKGYITPLNEILQEEELLNISSDYIDIAIDYATFNSNLYYIPRKLEANTFLYLKSELEGALSIWREYRDEIDLMFKKFNNYGLPSNYHLEEDPNLWDWFDLAVVSYIWSRIPDNTGLIWPRLAHRGKDYDGTTVELITKSYQAGATIDETLSLQGEGVLDVMVWEAFFVENNLYNENMWKESWSGGGIWNGMKNGEVYAAFMHQLDSFFIHGGTHPAMSGFLDNPEDMDVAIMPKGVSLELDSDGKPLRSGGHYSATNGWWWGVPSSSSDRELALQVIQLITSYDFHKDEALTFGMLPVRKDVYNNLGEMKEWQQRVFSVGLEQFNNYGIKSPINNNYTEISSIIREAWFNIIVQRAYVTDDGNIDRELIDNSLEEYRERIAKYLP